MTVQIKHDTAGVATFQAGGSGNVTLTLPTSTGTLATTADTGVTGFTSSQNTSSPNNTVNASRLLVSASSTDADIVLQPKGEGSLLAELPDGTSAGGNKRGKYVVDWQRVRSNAYQVASSDFCTISGGHTNTASNGVSTVGGGRNNAATGLTCCTISGGRFNTANKADTFIGGGNYNTASGYGAVVCCGLRNTASGNYSSVLGGCYGTTRGLHGMSAMASGKFGTLGDAQRGQYILRGLTTNGTLQVLTANQGAASTTNQVILPNNSCYGFEGRVTSHRTDVIGAGAIWTFSGGIRRGANAASTVMITVCTPVQISADAEAIGWLLEVTEDTTNGGLKVSFTGEASKTIRTVCVIETTECTS